MTLTLDYGPAAGRPTTHHHRRCLMARTRQPSRADRWAEACATIRAAVQASRDALADAEGAFSDLRDLQGEYQDWLDNLPDNLRESPVGGKLQEVTALDLEPDEGDLEAIENAVDEAEGADLPLGFGRD